MSFGLDSVIESASALVLIWRLRKHGKVSLETEAEVERWAARLVAITFFLLGAYVLFESIWIIVHAEKPEASLPGIIIAIVSLFVMPILAGLKRDVGKKLGVVPWSPTRRRLKHARFFRLRF